jgi:hypothetical protein
MLGLFAFTLNAVIVFVAIPRLSNRLHRSYNQNEYADGYDQLAENLVEGNGYRMYPDTAPTMVREPGYPLLLAGIFSIFGNNFAIVKLANLLLACGTAYLLVGIVSRFSHNTTLLYLPSVLYLVHSGTIIAETRGGVEGLFTFFLTLYVWTLYRAIETRHLLNYAISGLALGVTVLVKSTPMFFPLFVFAYLLFLEPHRWQSALRNVILMTGAMLLVLSPWIVRNYLISGRIVPTATVLGVSAHAGQYINAHLTNENNWAQVDRAAAMERKEIARQLGYPFKEVTNAYYEDFYSTQDEINFSHYLFAKVIDEYTRSPALFIRSAWGNLFNLWFRGKTWTSTEMNLIVQIPYLLMAVIGVGVTIHRKRFATIAPIVLLLSYMTGVYVALLAQARYSVPLIPFVSIMASIGLLAFHSDRTFGSLITRSAPGRLPGELNRMPLIEEIVDCV